jgi:hypothetical protein
MTLIRVQICILIRIRDWIHTCRCLHPREQITNILIIIYLQFHHLNLGEEMDTILEKSSTQTVAWPKSPWKLKTTTISGLDEGGNSRLPLDHSQGLRTAVGREMPVK